MITKEIKIIINYLQLIVFTNLNNVKPYYTLRGGDKVEE